MKISLIRRGRRADAAFGVTLVELLVTIMIIGILSSSVLFAMSVAQEASRKARTQALIATLHSLVLERWETYLNKRQNSSNMNIAAVANSRKDFAELRLTTTRQLLKMDFPDQFNDCLPSVLTNHTGSLRVEELTALSDRYAWHLLQADSHVADENQGAECLYLIVSSIRSDGGNWKKVDESFIGDTDNDNAPEFLDGWGRPVEFIRWPAGFASDMQAGQPDPPLLTPPAARNYNSPWVVKAATVDHDPFDPFRADPLAYRLVPLIFSAGPDGIYDLIKPFPQYSDSEFAKNRWNPHFLFEWPEGSGKYRRMGEPFDVNEDGVENWHDNIHNHLISAR